MSARATLIAALGAAALLGCIDTSVEATTVALSVAGTAVDEPIEGRGGALVTLERADVAFGPLYLCSGAAAGELCDEALAEWRDAVVVDALDADPAEVGDMVAITGTARSYMYDHGIVSRLTTPDDPLVTEAAASLGGASVVVEGTAEVGGQAVPFTARVRIEQSGDVEQGVPVVRSGDDGFEERILPDGRLALTVRFDPRPWLASARFEALVEDGACEAGREVVCAGAIEQRCAEDGSVAETTDCAAMDQVCLRDLGCVERVELGADDQIGRSLRSGVEAGERPAFQFESQ